MSIFTKLITRVEEIFSSVCLGLMVVIISVQVFQRYVLQSSLDWSEELSRYLFIWAVYVGCSFATREDRHLEVTILRHAFGGKLAKSVTIISGLCSIVFCVCTSIWGFQMVNFLAATGQKTPALEVQMYWVFLSVPVGMGLMGIRTLERLFGVISGKIEISRVEM